MVTAALGAGRISQGCHLHQDESQLERPPGRHRLTIGVGRQRRAGLSQRQRRVRGTRLRHQRGDPLVSHHPVHELETQQGLLVRGDVIQPRNQPLVGLPGLPQRHLRCRTQMLRQCRSRRLLSIEPVTVAADQGFQAGPQILRAGV